MKAKGSSSAELEALQHSAIEISAAPRADAELAIRRQREQMLKLVAKGFYNELMNYGVQKEEILCVASHLLDNLLAQDQRPGSRVEYYNRIFTIDSVQDRWAESRELVLQHVTLRPLDADVIRRALEWLDDAAVRESFVPAFPATGRDLESYFKHPGREFFGIYHENEPVGLIGGENVDTAAGKVEMKKLVGAQLRGKGIGKRATFAFLYYAFLIRNMNKVYIHSRDINMRNINLNSRFGFELEGVFFEDLCIDGKRQDIIRMALFRQRWLNLFRSAAGEPA